MRKKNPGNYKLKKMIIITKSRKITIQLTLNKAGVKSADPLCRDRKSVV